MRTHQRACTWFWKRAYQATSQGHSGFHPANQRAYTVRRALTGETTHAAHKPSSHSCLLERTCFEHIKFSRKQDVFDHRAILIFMGIETWLGF